MTADLTWRLYEHVRSASSSVVGVSVGNWADRSSWRIDYADGATNREIEMATGAMAAFDVTTERLNLIKARAIAAIDEAAAGRRGASSTPGMDLTYSEKFAQAQAVNAMGETAANALSQVQREAQFPTLSASVGIEHATLWGAAQIVLQRYAAFAQLSMSIERARLAGKRAVGEAQTVEAVQAAYEAVTWPT